MTAKKPNNISELILLIVMSVVVWVVVLFGMSSCKTTECLPEFVEVRDTIVRTDSVYIQRERDSVQISDKRDSTYIYEKDSVSEKQNGDTIRITRWKVKYIYKERESSDTQQTTMSNTQTHDAQAKETNTGKQLKVKRERYVPNFYKFTMWFFWIVIAVLVGWLVWWLADYIPALGTAKNWLKLLFKIK